MAANLTPIYDLALSVDPKSRHRTIGNPLCLGLLRAEAEALARTVVFIWHSGSFPKLTGCRQNPFPYGCSTEVLIFLLAWVGSGSPQLEAACGSSLCGSHGQFMTWICAHFQVRWSTFL